MNTSLKTRKVKLPKSSRRIASANGAPPEAFSANGAPSNAKLKALKQKLIRQGVKYCLGAYVDIHGVPKGKFVPIDHFEHFAHGSELYTGYALDGLGQEPNDDEISSVPDLNHIIQLPWQKEVAWMPADNHFHGQPYPLNSRVLLKTCLSEAANWASASTSASSAKSTCSSRMNAARSSSRMPTTIWKRACYDVKRLLRRVPVARRHGHDDERLGWDVYSFDHEDGNSQFEFDFKYADALTMADRYIFFRHMAKAIAAKHGLLATFMPKPFPDKTGNGAHFNMSLADARTGKNLFAVAPEKDPRGLGLSSLGYSFIAGILRHGPALCAALAPTVNSYKRLIRRGAMSYYSWAPVFNSFGTNNRTNSIRVPMGGGRCESRNADSSCNPYLAAALVLAAGLEGVSGKLDPGDPHHENLYELTPAELARAGVQELPRTLGEAVDAFAADPFTEKILGAELKAEFIKYKRAEWQDYHQSVSQWEIDRYARLF